jgi:hypothetical protein
MSADQGAAAALGAGFLTTSLQPLTKTLQPSLCSAVVGQQCLVWLLYRWCVPCVLTMHTLYCLLGHHTCVKTSGHQHC